MASSPRSPSFVQVIQEKTGRRIPGLLIWGSAVAGFFLCLTFLFRLFWAPSSHDIPFIQGCPGPLRLKVSPAQEIKSRKIYEGLNRQTSTNPQSESLLPPLEAPLLEEETAPASEPVADSAEASSGGPSKKAPLKKVNSNPTPTPAAPAPQNPVRPKPSLDQLLSEIDDVILKKG